MSQQLWQLCDNPSRCWDYNWDLRELPARKFYLFVAEIGHRLRHLIVDRGPIAMIELCEQCAEGEISEEELRGMASKHFQSRQRIKTISNAWAGGIYHSVAGFDTYGTRSGIEYGLRAILFQKGIEIGLLRSSSFEGWEIIKDHPAIAFTREQTEYEWGKLVRCIYGPNPFRPVAFSPAWRSESAVALARTAYDTRDFALLPILADALEEAGCDHADVLNHCRDPKATHARGCWVVDLVLNKS